MSTPEEQGIVDQQGAAKEAMESEVPGPGSSATDSTAQREGIVDQQDAALEQMDDQG